MTDKNHNHLNPLSEGALKSHILNKNISLHFAGSSVAAEEVLKAIGDNFQDRKNIILNEIIKIIENILKSEPAYFNTDFLLVDVLTDSITKITNNETLLNLENHYIGDVDAYRYYTNEYSNNLKKYYYDGDSNSYHKYDEYLAMTKAFESSNSRCYSLNIE